MQIELSEIEVKLLARVIEHVIYTTQEKALTAQAIETKLDVQTRVAEVEEGFQVVSDI